MGAAHISESQSSGGGKIGKSVGDRSGSDVGDSDRRRLESVLCVIERNLRRRDDRLEPYDSGISVDKASSLLGDIVELGSSNRAGDRDGGVLEDISDSCRVHLSVVTDEESDDSRDEGSLKEKERRVSSRPDATGFQVRSSTHGHGSARKNRVAPFGYGVGRLEEGK